MLPYIIGGLIGYVASELIREETKPEIKPQQKQEESVIVDENTPTETKSEKINSKKEKE